MINKFIFNFIPYIWKVWSWGWTNKGLCAVFVFSVSLNFFYVGYLIKCNKIPKNETIYSSKIGNQIVLQKEVLLKSFNVTINIQVEFFLEKSF